LGLGQHGQDVSGSWAWAPQGAVKTIVIGTWDSLTKKQKIHKITKTTIKINTWDLWRWSFYGNFKHQATYIERKMLN
jgi:hypothetical protein